MNKTELVAAVAEQADISKKDAEKALKAFVDVVTEEMKKGDIIEIQFGTKTVKAEVLDLRDTTKKEEAADLFRYL